MSKPMNKKRAQSRDKTPAIMQDQRIEGELLGVLMRSPSQLYKAHEILKPEHFSCTAFASLYQAMMRIYNEGKPMDYAMLAQVLQQDSPSVKLEQVAHDLTALTVSEDALEYYANYLKELARRRLLERALLESLDMVQDEAFGCDELFQQVTTYLFKLGDTVEDHHFHLFADLLAANRADWEARHDGEEPSMGLTTGFAHLDEATLGFRGGELILIAGNTGHGKTALVLNIVKHILLHEQQGVIIYSLEMAAAKLSARMVRSHFAQRVKYTRGQTMQEEDWQVVQQAFDDLVEQDLPLYIDDSPSMSIEEFYGKAMYAVKTLHVGMIIVDYAQLMGGEGYNRQEEVTDVVTGLRRVAIKLGVPVVALVQFNRNDPKEQYLRLPKLESMRESGSLEFTADIVLSIMRPERKIESSSIGGIPLKDRAILSVLKNRDGSNAHIDMIFTGDLIRFEELPSTMPSLVHAVRRTGGKPDIQANESMPKPTSQYTRQGYMGSGVETKSTSPKAPRLPAAAKAVSPYPDISPGGYVNNEELESNYPKKYCPPKS